MGSRPPRLAEAGNLLETATVIAPFGASAVLLFAAPAGPFAQPRNAIGGHLLCSVIGVLVVALLGDTPIAMGAGVALAIALMMLTDTVHPPAGADPLVAIVIGAGWQFPVQLGQALHREREGARTRDRGPCVELGLRKATPDSMAVPPARSRGR